MGGEWDHGPQKFSWHLRWPPTFLEGHKIFNLEHIVY